MKVMNSHLQVTDEQQRTLLLILPVSLGGEHLACIRLPPSELIGSPPDVP